MSARRLPVLVLRGLVLVAMVGVAVAFGPRVTGSIAGWRTVPAITVIAAKDDQRLPAVREAVDHWNHTFEQIGTPFRLGAVVVVPGPIPASDLQALSTRSLRSIGLRARPTDLDRFPGDLLITLSDAEFISFTSRVGDRVLVGIKSERLFPLTLPNVVRNVVAHEIGHAIGLAHNTDETTLMCGRPSPCRPQVFQSDTARFFPLTDDDRARLRHLYPPTWTEQR